MEMCLLLQGVGVIASMLFLSLIHGSNWDFEIPACASESGRMILNFHFSAPFWYGIALLFFLLCALGYLFSKIFANFHYHKVINDPTDLLIALIGNMSIFVILDKILVIVVGYFSVVDYKREWMWYMIPSSVRVQRNPGHFGSWLIMAGILLSYSAMYRIIYLLSIALFRSGENFRNEALRRWRCGRLKKVMIGEMKKISEEVKELQKEVRAYESNDGDGDSSVENPNFAELAEFLTQSVLKVSELDSHEIEEIKLAKKECLDMIENTMDLIKEKAGELIPDAGGDGDKIMSLLEIDVLEEDS